MMLLAYSSSSTSLVFKHRGLVRFSRLCVSPKLQPPKDFKAPEPKPLSISDGNYRGFLSGTLAAVARLGTGVFVFGWSPFKQSDGPWPGTLGFVRDGSSLLSSWKRPLKPVIIYEYESSPFCRKVREACSVLDLTVEYRPCPGARSGWSDDMLKLSGRRTVPYMIDGSVSMFESDDIIAYLFDSYGPGRSSIPWALKGDFARDSAAYAASVRDYAGYTITNGPFLNIVELLLSV